MRCSLVAYSILMGISLNANARSYHILFNTGSYHLTDQGKRYIDSLVYNEIIHPGLKLDLIGYADYVGDSTGNLLLSQNRANSIRDYLVSMNFKKEDIETVQGKGEIFSGKEDGNDGVPFNRRVDISIRQPQHRTQPFVTDASKLKVNDIIRLNILFKESSHQYLPKSVPLLDSFYMLMKNNPGLRVSIEGHICCGSHPNDEGMDMDTRKMGLSFNRAKAVYDYLIKRGIDAARMSYKGMRFSHPLYPAEETQEQRDLNKRVEVRIIGK